MASLIDVLDESDFGLFILSPDDVAAIRDDSKQVIRDNVIFELGLFIGRLGSDRCFMIVPSGVEDLHLPSDLLGLTPATFQPDRQDGNMVAALGPACNRIRKAIGKLGAVIASSKSAAPDPIDERCSDPEDCRAIIQSWMGNRPARLYLE
jgi:predicted nucleotide-binding protein